MADNGSKKKRIARIGNTSSGKATSKLNNGNGVAQADHNLVYGIMESMDKTNLLSYQELQEVRSKEKPTYRNKKPSSKQNVNATCAKPAKKFTQERTFTLMEKCKKSMKYLKKNMCIPKPRAHVGFVPRPTPNPTPSFIPNKMHDNILSKTAVGRKECSVKVRNSHKSSSPETNDRRKKAKISNSVDNLPHLNAPQAESGEHAESIDYGDSDSDETFERFLKKHNPEKHGRRKIHKETKRKKIKKLECSKKITKITSKVLSDSEDSAESNSFTETVSKRSKLDQELPPTHFQRIIANDNGESDSADDNVDYSCPVNYDSSSSEDEVLSKESTLDFVSTTASHMFSEEKELVASATSLLEHKATPTIDELKSRCKLPCYVVLKRDILLEKKAASLHSYSLTNSEPASNLDDDDDDCIVITEASKDTYTVQNMLTKEGNSSQRTISTIPSSISETVAEKIAVQEENTHNTTVVSTRNNMTLQFGTNSHEYSASVIIGDESMPLKTRDKILSNVAPEYGEKSTLSEHSSDLTDETSGSLSCDGTNCADTFQVQILSVKSLNESDVILLSDEEDDKDTGSVPSLKETKECEAEDSDVEIIGLDSRAIRGKFINENAKDNSKDESQNKVTSLKENSNNSTRPLVSSEDDCIILDYLDLPSKTKNITIGEEEKISILKTLEKINIDCIKKVLKETTTDITKDSIQGNSASSLGDGIQSLEQKSDPVRVKLKQNPNDVCLSQKQTSVDTSITIIGEVNKNGAKTFDASQKHSKLVQNSEILHVRSDSENLPSSAKPKNVPSKIVSIKSTTVCVTSGSNVTAGNSPNSQKETDASGHEANVSLHSLKSQQLIPVCTKLESYENLSDELDIIASKSIQTFSDAEKKTIVPLFDLYKTEYEKFMQIKSTEQNVTAGLKLLEEKQYRKLHAISSSIKNILKKDSCFFNVIDEIVLEHNQSPMKCATVKRNPSLDEIKPSECATRTLVTNDPDIEKDDKVNIFNPSVVESVSETLNPVGPSSSREVYNHLINSVCAECGKQAMAACSGCAKIYYCSEKCGISSWDKGHFANCST